MLERFSFETWVVGNGPVTMVSAGQQGLFDLPQGSEQQEQPV